MDQAEPPKPSSPAEKAQKSATRSFYLSVFALVVAIAAIVFAVFAWEQYIQVQSGTDNKTVQLNNKQAKTDESVQQLMQSISTNQQNIAALQQQVSTLTHALNLNKQQGTLGQIAYLVHLANLQLSISHDAQSALHLLKLAKSKVDALDDPALFNLNKSLSNDIIELGKVPKIDLSDIVARIDSLNRDVQRATIPPSEKDLTETLSQKKDDDNSTPPKTQKWYQKALGKLSGVKDLVIIRKNQKARYPLMVPEQQESLKANIQSKLLQAEAAAAQHNNKLYQQHLTIVKSWVDSYFHTSNEKDSILKQLATLQAINVNPAIPDISDSLSAITQSLSKSYDISNKDTDNKTPKSDTPEKQKPSAEKGLLEDNRNAGVEI